MADVTKSVLLRNAGATITEVNGAAQQEIVWNRNDTNIMFYVRNTDATTVLVRVEAEGFGGGKKDLDVQVAQNAIRGFSLESFRFKDVATQRIIVRFLAVGGGAFGGTITNVRIAVIETPKSLID